MININIAVRLKRKCPESMGNLFCSLSTFTTANRHSYRKSPNLSVMPNVYLIENIEENSL